MHGHACMCYLDNLFACVMRQMRKLLWSSSLFDAGLSAKLHVFCIKFVTTLFHDVAVSAVEQLQVMASKRQYKEAAAQLVVFYLSILKSVL
ncbi:hypothetical protein QYF36_017446 [Acer negundo]|nr:hypothetical protein QYF36_017446 [Acer negundo]